MQRNFLYEKQRRSMTMCQPSEQQDLSKLLLDHDEEQQHEEQKKKAKAFEDHLKADEINNRRETVNSKFFYDERPNNTIFLETSKE